MAQIAKLTKRRVRRPYRTVITLVRSKQFNTSEVVDCGRVKFAKCKMY